VPPVLKQRLGLPWTAADQRTLDRLGAVSRSVAPRLPVVLRYHPRRGGQAAMSCWSGPGWRRWTRPT
jgi:uncharacterized protein (DUF2236 family)